MEDIFFIDQILDRNLALELDEGIEVEATVVIGFSVSRDEPAPGFEVVTLRDVGVSALAPRGIVDNPLSRVWPRQIIVGIAEGRKESNDPEERDQGNHVMDCRCDVKGRRFKLQ